jgi:hypothetical protein
MPSSSGALVLQSDHFDDSVDDYLSAIVEQAMETYGLSDEDEAIDRVFDAISDLARLGWIDDIPEVVSDRIEAAWLSTAYQVGLAGKVIEHLQGE